MTFLYLNSDQMGRGDEELGRRLLISFLRELLDSGEVPDIIGCVHSAVKLSTQAGEAAEILEAFRNKGAWVASCGSCLDHYGLREKVIVGEIGNMKQSVEVFSKADRIIAPC